MLHLLAHVDKGLAAQVASGLGLQIPTDIGLHNTGIPADADPNTYQPVVKKGSLEKSAALSMANNVLDSIKTRKIAFLVADGVDEKSLSAVKDRLLKEGAVVDLIAPHLGTIMSENNTSIAVDKSLLTTPSVVYDAVYVPAGANSAATLAADADAVHFLNEAFKHCKPIAGASGAMPVFEACNFYKKLPENNSDETVIREGVVISEDPMEIAGKFVLAIKQHRFWKREKPRKIPA
jgi:catalase